MSAALPPSEAFVDQIMRAIVNQFFENPQIVVTDGSPFVPPRSTPSQVVAARLLQEKQGELLDAIMERLDVDTFAETVAQRAVQVLTTRPSAYGYNSAPDDVRRRELQKRVDERLVELMAADLFAKMHPEATDDDDEPEAQR